MTDLELTQEEMIALILKLLEKPKVIAFNNAFWDICKDVNITLFLSQLFYWSKAMSFKPFYKSLSEWETETHLSRYYIDQAREFLKRENILFEERKGVPCRVHYKLNLEGLLRALIKVTTQFEKNSQTGLQNISKLDCENVANKFANCSQTITENNTEITTEKEKDTTNVVSKKADIPYSEIITYLNQKAGTSYRQDSKDTKSLIKARWNAGYRLEDFKQVIDNMVAKWLTDENMCQYLRPSTLFSGKNFEAYLQTVKPKQRNVWGEIIND